MALTLNKANGTVTANGTEQTVRADTDSGVYEATVNLVNMADGDTLELRVYKKVLSGDAQSYCVLYDTLSGKQGDGAAVGSSADAPVLWRSGPITSPLSITVTLKQTAGTNRAYPWVWDQVA